MSNEEVLFEVLYFLYIPSFIKSNYPYPISTRSWVEFLRLNWDSSYYLWERFATILLLLH